MVFQKALPACVSTLFFNPVFQPGVSTKSFVPHRTSFNLAV